MAFLKSLFRKLFLTRKGRWVVASVVLFLAGSAVNSRYGFVRRLEFDTRQELLTYEEDRHFDLWRGTSYCGDKDGRSWFLNRQDLFGNALLSIPSDQWQPPFRRPYSFWQRSQWLDWRKVGPELGEIPIRRRRSG